MALINRSSDTVTHRSSRKKLGLLVLSIIAIIAVILAVVFYLRYADLKKNPNAAAESETKSLVAKVGTLIALPKDETPTVATVQDKAKLKDQPFFASAENGDKLLIYTNAKKAIVYREKSNKIINVGPIAIDSTAAQPAATDDKKTE